MESNLKTRVTPPKTVEWLVWTEKFLGIGFKSNCKNVFQQLLKKCVLLKEPDGVVFSKDGHAF